MVSSTCRLFADDSLIYRTIKSTVDSIELQNDLDHLQQWERNWLMEGNLDKCQTIMRLHGRVVKGVGHLGHSEAMEAGGREFDPRPGHYSRMSF